MDLKIRELRELVICEELNLNSDFLFEVFSNNLDETVYIIDSNTRKINGIVTLGNFRRNLLQGQTLVNRDFLKLNIQDEKNVEKILNENNKIKAVPIIDSEGGIVREIRKEEIKVNSDKTCYEIIPYLLELCRIHYTKLIVCGEQNSICCQFESYFEEVKYCDELTINQIQQLEMDEGLLVVDIDDEKWKIRDLIYKKYNINNITLSDLKRCMDEVLCFKQYSGGLLGYIKNRISRYTKVAMPTYLKKYVESTENASLIEYWEAKDFIWNKEKKCIEYNGVAGENVECFMIPFYVYKCSNIRVKDNIIPIQSFFYAINSSVHLEANDYDVAINIVPKLEKAGVKCVIVRNPEIEYKKIESMFDMDVSKRGFWMDPQQKEKVELFLNKDIIDEKEKMTQKDPQNAVICDNGVRKRISQSRFYTYFGDERYTCNNSKENDNSIYMFGPCIVMGAFVKDADTIASRMAEKIGDMYNIKNYGEGAWSLMTERIRNRTYVLGDVVIIFSCYETPYIQKGIKTHSIIEAYKRVLNLQDNIWDNLLHCNYKVSKEIADELYLICDKEDIFKIIEKNEKVVSFGYSKNQVERKESVELQQWLKKVSKYKRKKDDYDRVGSIVMNCNPFTIGHRYLIEKAADKVDILYIFVVEENKSFFDFEDRFCMVKLGVSDLKNVVVVPSGKFIISTTTLPGYFEKDKQPFITLDATDDLEIFASIIAKEFDISIRFAGEEPIDMFTNRYNLAMSEILPRYGVKFEEIPRIEYDGAVISASRVRSCMKEKDYNSIRNLVLPCVYEYLQNKYFEQ